MMDKGMDVNTNKGINIYIDDAIDKDMDSNNFNGYFKKIRVLKTLR